LERLYHQWGRLQEDWKRYGVARYILGRKKFAGSGAIVPLV